jgi:hypothetical protein
MVVGRLRILHNPLIINLHHHLGDQRLLDQHHQFMLSLHHHQDQRLFLDQLLDRLLLLLLKSLRLQFLQQRKLHLIRFRLDLLLHHFLLLLVDQRPLFLLSIRE